VFDDVILDIGERDQLQFFILAAVFTPAVVVRWMSISVIWTSFSF
jgi:hypothetical protein